MQGSPEGITRLVATMLPQAEVCQIDGPTWQDLVTVADEDCSGGSHPLPDTNVYRFDENDDELYCPGCTRARLVASIHGAFPNALATMPVVEMWARCDDCHYWHCRCEEED